MGDPREAGPQIEALEARNPVVSDLGLESGNRIDFIRHDGGSEGITFANDSGSYSVAHMQSFVPVDGRSMDDVVMEVLEVAEAAGWEMYANSRGTKFCGQRPLDSTAQSIDLLRVYQGDVVSIGEGNMSAVRVGLGG